MNVIYHPEAEEELIAAARFYDERVPGLGADFLNEFDAAVEEIITHPTRWRKVEADFRRVLLSHHHIGRVLPQSGETGKATQEPYKSKMFHIPDVSTGLQCPFARAQKPVVNGQ